MDDIERIKEQLENIQGVSPLITSLRTIAAGGWRTALKHLQAAEGFSEQVSGVLSALLARYQGRPWRHPAVAAEGAHLGRVLMLVIASEQGLCGAFNDLVLDGAEKLISQQQLRSDQVLVATLGRKAERFFRARGYDLFANYAMPVTRVPTLTMVTEIIEGLLAAYYDGEVDAVFVIYSPYRPAISLPPVVERWLPVDSAALPVHSESWPEAVIETVPQELFEQAITAWIHARFYQYVMSSSASEQSARYRAMENATSNIERLIGELTLSYHAARQHAITMEMLDLVAASSTQKHQPRQHNR